MTAGLVIVLLVALLRLAELVHARRNEGRLIAQGGIEAGRAHYPLLVLLHAAWLTLLGAEALHGVPIDRIWLAIFLLLQPMRAWTILSLGRFWTTRVITLPDWPLVRRGPYRWLRHPNYLIVELEIVSLPLALGVWPAAVFFGVANAALLAWRIRTEEKALARRRGVYAVQG